MPDDSGPVSDNTGAGFFESFKIAIRESADHSDIWIDMGNEFLRLGWLCRALRGPDEIHLYIVPATELCVRMAREEVARAEKFLDHILENKRDNLCEIDGNWAE